MSHPATRLRAGTLTGLVLLAGPGYAADEPAQALPEVLVVGTGVREGNAAQGYVVDKVRLGPLGEQSLQDAPYSVTAVSADLIANTQASNISEAVRYVPTVYTNSGSSQVTPFFTLRGFTASQTTGWNASVDGLRSWDIYQPVEDKERIEIMPGATGFLSGVTSAAGMINYVTKEPTAAPFAEFTVGSEGDQVYGHLDMGGPLADRPDLAFRMNVVYGNDGATGTDHQSQARQSVSGVLDWRFSPETRLSLEGAYAKRHVDNAQSVFMTTAAIGIPQAPDASKNWGAPYDHAYDESTRIGASLESRLNEVFRLRAQLRHSDIEREYLWSRVVWQSPALNYKWQLDANGPFKIAVDQYAAFVDADFATGPLSHKLTLGFSHDDYDKAYDGTRRYVSATVYPGNIYGDPWYPPYPVIPATSQYAQQTRYDTLILADRIAIGRQWELMLGANHARIDDRSSTQTTAGVVTTVAYDSSKTTPALTLSFKPLPTLTTYLSYLETLQPGFVSTTAGNKGALFPPTVGRQNEVGAKFAWDGLNITGARFNIEQANAYTDAATQVTNQDGREIHRGWEFSVTGRATDRLSLVGGFTTMDAHVEKAASNVGKIPQGVPEHMAKLYAEYDLPGMAGLTLTGGLSYTGRTPWDPANTRFVDAVTVADAGLRYRTRTGGKDTVYRAQISNLTGKDYWTTRSSILYLGAPRTLSLSATVSF